MSCSCLPPWLTDRVVERACDRHDEDYASPIKSRRRKLIADLLLSARVALHGFRLAVRGVWFIAGLAPLMLIALTIGGSRWYWTHGGTR